MSDASVVHLPTTQTMTLEPQTLAEAMHLATVLAKSTLLPRHLVGSPANVLLIMMRSRQLGISMFEGFANMHVVDGRVGLSAELMAALVQRAPVVSRLQMVESTDKLATYELLRRDHPSPIRLTYRLEQAQRAGLAGKDNWRKYPEAMLRARCLSALIRANCQDCLTGIYSMDELEEIADRERGRGGAANADAPAPAQPALLTVPTNPVLPASTTVEAPVVAGARTAQLKSRLAAKAARAPAPVEPAPETPYARVLAACARHGITDKGRRSSVITGATGKTRPDELTDDDVARVEDALLVMAQMPSDFDDPMPPPPTKRSTIVDVQEGETDEEAEARQL